MNNSEFHQLAGQLMLNIKETFDDFTGNADINYEIHGGVITLIFRKQQQNYHQLPRAAPSDMDDYQGQRRLSLQLLRRHLDV